MIFGSTQKTFMDVLCSPFSVAFLIRQKLELKFSSSLQAFFLPFNCVSWMVVVVVRWRHRFMWKTKKMCWNFWKLSNVLNLSTFTTNHSTFIEQYVCCVWGGWSSVRDRERGKEWGFGRALVLCVLDKGILHSFFNSYLLCWPFFRKIIRFISYIFGAHSGELWVVVSTGEAIKCTIWITVEILQPNRLVYLSNGLSSFK